MLSLCAARFCNILPQPWHLVTSHLIGLALNLNLDVTTACFYMLLMLFYVTCFRCFSETEAGIFPAEAKVKRKSLRVPKWNANQ